MPGQQSIYTKQDNLPASNKVITIGVLALQGAFREHINALKDCGVKAIEVRQPAQLLDIDGIIIPGGESTTISKLMVKYGFIEALKSFYLSKKPIFGTCAGLVLLARAVSDFDEKGLGFIDITVSRNAYGRQLDSFECPLKITGIGKNNSREFNGIFIRAPRINSAGENVEIICSYEGEPVMAKENNILVCAFHPELTDDISIHKYFIDMVKKNKNDKI